jgi:hypothetical protein
VRAAVLLHLTEDAPLRLALSLGVEELVAVRAGPAVDAEEAALSRALSAGAHRAVRIWDPALPGLDYLGLATILSGVIRALDCRLVIAGDRGQGAVGPAVAERLELPHLCGVLSASLTTDAAQGAGAAELLVKRRILGGTQELRGGRDAVLCVLSAAGPALAPELSELLLLPTDSHPGVRVGPPPPARPEPVGGTPGAGKTAIINRAAAILADNKLRTTTRIYSITTAQIIATAQGYIGQWQAQLQSVLDGVRAEDGVLYYCDIWLSLGGGAPPPRRTTSGTPWRPWWSATNSRSCASASRRWCARWSGGRRG